MNDRKCSFLVQGQLIIQFNRLIKGKDCFLAVFTARRYACVVYATALCLSVCLSNTSRSSISMALYIVRQTTLTIAQGLEFSLMLKILLKKT